MSTAPTSHGHYPWHAYGHNCWPQAQQPYYPHAAAWPYYGSHPSNYYAHMNWTNYGPSSLQLAEEEEESDDSVSSSASSSDENDSSDAEQQNSSTAGPPLTAGWWQSTYYLPHPAFAAWYPH